MTCIPDMEEAERHSRARLVVSELDVATALTFRRRLRALTATNTHVLVDLSQLDFIDLAGARALNDAITQSQGGHCRVEVAPGMSDQARRFFDLMTTVGIQTSF